MPDIPKLDLARYQSGQMSADEQQRMLAALARACEDHGFFLLVGHDCEALIEAVFRECREFFALPRAQKLAVARDAHNPLGYFDRELTKQKRDQKEVFDFKTGGHQSARPERQSRWPQGGDTFRAVLTEYFCTFTQLAEATTRVVMQALGLSAAQVAQTLTAGFGDRHTSAARLNFYPYDDPVPTAERTVVNALGDMALHHHTDPGALTLLLQDARGGLQAYSKREGWVDVPPEPGTIVVNIGDVLQVWTNDRCVAGVHRVVPISHPQGRYSIPFFYQPSFDAEISPWLAPGETARYRSFSWRDYIHARVTDNFSDVGEDDIQISRFAL